MILHSAKTGSCSVRSAPRPWLSKIYRTGPYTEYIVSNVSKRAHSVEIEDNFRSRHLRLMEIESTAGKEFRCHLGLYRGQWLNNTTQEGEGQPRKDQGLIENEANDQLLTKTDSR